MIKTAIGEQKACVENMFNDIMNINSIVMSLRTCHHEHWKGCPEVDAYCAKCGLDEFEVHDENENLWAEAMHIYYEE